MPTPQQTAFQRLLTIMDELREQCPWDKKQTFLSLRKLTIEETYELADELLKEDISLKLESKPYADIDKKAEPMSMVHFNIHD